MTENNERKIYDFIKGNLINFVIVITSLIYILFNMVVIKPTDATIGEITAKAGLSLIVGFMIKQAMSENGFNKGYRSNIWRTNLETYSNACNLANPYIERVDNFYACEEIERKRNYRRANLMAVRLKYDWFFDEKGNYIKNEEREKNLDKHQRKILEKCVKVKIYPLNLFSEYSSEVSADTKKEWTDKNQRAKMIGKNSMAQLVTAIIGAYFLPVFDGWSWAEVIMSTVQVCIWLSCGVMQLYTNYNYVVVDKIAKLTRKKELIVKFTRGCENGEYLVNPYEQEKTNEIQN